MTTQENDLSIINEKHKLIFDTSKSFISRVSDGELIPETEMQTHSDNQSEVLRLEKSYKKKYL